jgi:hypothetical protein
MVTSLTNIALLTQPASFVGTNTVGVTEAVGDSPVIVATASVGVLVAGTAVVVGGAVVAGTAVGASVVAAGPPHADKTIPASKMIENAFLDMLASFLQAH